MLELLSPAGSMDSLMAAVQNGADAVYMGYGDFNARRNAKNFTEADFASAVSYCHLRGVKVYLTLNPLLTDRELPPAADLARRASEIGADAVLVQDLGVLRAVRQVAPDLPVHASTQMTVHSLDGVKLCADLGMKRAVLSRELPADQIEYICQHSPIEIEVFGHGALCMCYSGQCFFSALVGGRSGNRGMCAQPCRLNYGWGQTADKPLLSLKDMSLAKHLQELEEMGYKLVIHPLGTILHEAYTMNRFYKEYKEKGTTKDLFLEGIFEKRQVYQDILGYSEAMALREKYKT